WLYQSLGLKFLSGAILRAWFSHDFIIFSTISYKFSKLTTPGLLLGTRTPSGKRASTFLSQIFMCQLIQGSNVLIRVLSTLLNIDIPSQPRASVIPYASLWHALIVLLHDLL
ncbi:hypothetical protein ACJX0J_013195, partial [Zea mays]